ncbi:hypothetical protein LINPERPRIM_LOCUS11650 [Linum perenne]
MGRGRGKGRKLTVSNHDDAESGEEERIPAQKRRGRPQKPLKDDIDDEEMEKLEEDEEVMENGKVSTITKDVKTPTAASSENGKRRRRNSQQTKEKQESVKEEEANGVGAISTSTNDSTKSSGFRKNGSRRKSKPHRAAEAGVECRLSGLMT